MATFVECLGGIVGRKDNKCPLRVPLLYLKSCIKGIKFYFLEHSAC